MPDMAGNRVTPAFINIEHPVILRELLCHMLDHADIVGEDRRGRPVLRIQLALEPWLLDKLAAIGAREAELEDNEREEEADLEDDEREDEAA